MKSKLIIFLLLNFAALALGGIFTNSGVNSTWYQSLNKAPWTPPGWVFGAAWTLIMVCFAIYMAYLYHKSENKQQIAVLYGVQLFLNIIWNPIFFYYHNALVGLIFIVSLTLLIGYLLFKYWQQLQLKSVFIVPYFIWLLIASSLNLYVLLYN